jgi:hypothetical protein
MITTITQPRLIDRNTIYLSQLFFGDLPIVALSFGFVNDTL